MGCFVGLQRNIEISVVCVTMNTNSVFLMISPKCSMYMVKSNSPNTEICGTNFCTCDRYDTSSFTATK